MKRFIPVAMALALLLAACGEDAPAPTSAQTEAVTPAVTEPAGPSDTPQPERGGLSPTAVAALNELEFIRGSELAGENDERLIRETLTYYFLMRNDMLCERGYDVPDFTTFFDTSSPDYDKLVYNVDKARYFGPFPHTTGVRRTLSQLRKKFGVVFQSDFLMAASVRGNIDFERGLSDEQIARAAEYAQASGFIGEHGGMEAELTARGSNFSGGQKQRLLIARALAASPEILVLDDSSSALDYKTDARLRKTLFENMPETTVVLIAQRISSVRFADHILVLDGGRMVGFGTDAELMQSCEEYRRIYDSQHGEGGEEDA